MFFLTRPAFYGNKKDANGILYLLFQGFVEVVIGPHMVRREDDEDVEPKKFTCPSEIADGVYEIQPEDRVNEDYANSGDSFKVEVDGDSLICTRTDREGYGWGMNLVVRLPLFNVLFQIIFRHATLLYSQRSIYVRQNAHETVFRIFFKM